MKKNILLFFILFHIFSCNEKSPKVEITNQLSNKEKIDSTNIKTFFNTALTHGQSYEWLRDLTSNIGGRLSGSSEAHKAVEWGEALMKEVGLDSVWLQPVTVPHWVRGEKEIANYTINGIQKNVPILAHIVKKR